jgi:hypothetical protein
MLVIWKDEIKPADASRIVKIDVKEFIINAVAMICLSGLGVIGVGFVMWFWCRLCAAAFRVDQGVDLTSS